MSPNLIGILLLFAVHSAFTLYIFRQKLALEEKLLLEEMKDRLRPTPDKSIKDLDVVRASKGLHTLQQHITELNYCLSDVGEFGAHWVPRPRCVR